MDQVLSLGELSNKFLPKMILHHSFQRIELCLKNKFLSKLNMAHPDHKNPFSYLR